MAQYNRVGIVQAFNLCSDFAKIMLDQLIQALDSRNTNFFQRYGMVTKSILDERFDTPIQCVEDIELDQNDELKTYSQPHMRGTPAVGACTPAVDSDRTFPQTTFKFKTLDLYSQALMLPKSPEEYVVPVTTFMNYGSQLRCFWEHVIEDTIWIYSTGMLCAVENWSSLEPSRKAGELDKTKESDVSKFVEYIKNQHKANPITSPSNKLSTWNSSTVLKAGATVDDTGATSSHTLMLSYIQEVKGCIDSQTVGCRNMQKPMFNVFNNRGEGSNQPHPIHEWMWVITPEIAHDLRKEVGSTNLASCGSCKQIDNGFGNAYVCHLLGFSFAECDSLPRYRGGASLDVPICRTIIFGQQAVEYGFRKYPCIGKRYTSLLNGMGCGMRFKGVRYRTWPFSENQGQYGILKSSCNFGVRKIRNQDNDTHEERDRGIMTVDIPYTARNMEKVNSLPTQAEAEKSLGI